MKVNVVPFVKKRTGKMKGKKLMRKEIRKGCPHSLVEKNLSRSTPEKIKITDKHKGMSIISSLVKGIPV